MPNQTGGKVLRYALLGAVALAAMIWPAARMLASPKPARHENAKTPPQAATARKSGSSTHAASKAGVNAASSTAHSTKSGTATHSTGKRTLASNRRGRSRREPKQMAPTPDRIREIQSALSMDGYYSAQPTGKWDGDTLGAMQRFQQAHGLSPSGKLDALTLQKLGLGSQIAGVSAPLPSPLAVPSRLAKNPAPETEEPSEPLGTTQP
ncbi:MAG: peptidoglycan-binding domain-containing protein [Candidatus Acidiferrales bacterium]